MKLLKVNSNDQAILNFYKRHYKTFPHLIPNNLEGLYYKLVDDDDQLLAVTKHTYPTPFLLRTSSTVVHKDLRGQGIGRILNKLVEDKAKENGVTKISCNIFVDNIPSIVLKLKLGYIIEGTLYDHDELGKHEYILGKKL